MIKTHAVRLASMTIVSLALALLSMPALAQESSTEGTTEAENTTFESRVKENVVDFVRSEIEEGKREATESAKEGIKGFLDSVGDFFLDTIGINLYEGLVLLGQFFLWLFESLASLVRWLLTL